MSAVCDQLDSGAVELYFYDEMPPGARDGMAAHLRLCRECASALEELKIIRAALASRPDVSAPASGDWSGFMQRLDHAVSAHRTGVPVSPSAPSRSSYRGLLAMAALLAIVAMSVAYVAKGGGDLLSDAPSATAQGARYDARTAGEGVPGEPSGMRSVGEQHFERSKLVVLGLSSKAAAGVDVADWAYERGLAASLLSDTRLYRMAAEARGLASLAGVMRDLELVLLETSMAQGSDPAELPQIQRLIRKRQLIEKMDVVNTIGLTP
ncbi:MAG TPA: hypothetical protein VNJ03_06685 [Vicinamibacterales bacterium]|nr:hypothetical protein [Vicinamibacterales bacterium]